MANNDEIELVVARLRTMPENAVVYVGIPSKPLTKDDMIGEVESNSEIGKIIVEMQMNYLRSLKGDASNADHTA